MKIGPPLLAWMVALATLAGAANELRLQRNMADITAALADLPHLTAQPSALTLADYQTIQKKTAVFGSVEITPSQEALTVKAMTLSDYAAWRLTVDQIILENSGIAWRIDYLCSGKCPSGEAHKATLTGTRFSSAS